MIIFGLGNPGRQYLLTRHNLGFMVLDFLAFHHKMKFKKMKSFALAEGIVVKNKITLCKPLGYMNNSGPVLKNILEARFPHGDYNEKPFLVICDDLNLPLGRTKLYRRGTDGGHLGLRSIIEALDTLSFLRLRLGIGPPPKTDWSQFVLSVFTDRELMVVPKMLERALDGIHIFLSRGLAAAQTFLNTRNIES